MDALFSEFECSQLKGQTDVFGQVEDALTDQRRARQAEREGSLFPVLVTDEPGDDGALFGLTI
jgi:hypothetical protein